MVVISKSEKIKRAFGDELTAVETYANENGMIYRMVDNQLIVLTEIAYWRIVYLPDWRSFVLYHGNTIPNDIDPANYVDAEYHFQKDVKPTESLYDLLVYIRLHDDFKLSQLGTVDEMPRRTKKQKKRYNKMKQKEKRLEEALILQMISAVALTKMNYKTAV